VSGNKSMISSVLGRKLLHITCAPAFVASWLLFSKSMWARWVAATVPMLSILRLFRASSIEASSSGLVRAVSRSGSSSETLGGPMYYSLVLLAATVFGWQSLVAAVAVSQMAVGDGIADIFGRRFGKTKWPFAKTKSVEGSAAFVLAAFAASLGMVALFHAAGYTALTAVGVAPTMLLITLFSAAIELLPGNLMDDNISVPSFAAALAYILLK